MATNTAQLNPPVRHIAQPQVCYIYADVAIADAGTAKVVGSIPAGALIIKPMSGVFVDTVFNAGTTNTIDIGNTGTGAAYLSAGSLTATAFVPCATTTNVYKLTSDTTVTATVTLAGTTATTGSARVVIAYIEAL